MDEEKRSPKEWIIYYFKSRLIWLAKAGLLLGSIYLVMGWGTMLFSKSGIEKNEEYFKTFKLEEDQLPIFYSDLYNISLWGIEKIHPFDSMKYKHSVDALKELNVIGNGKELFSSPRPDLEYLKKSHKSDYLNNLESSWNLMHILEVGPVVLLPWQITHRKVLLPMLHQTGGTILAAKAAVTKGWAINLGGGFHHASAAEGGGFCVYSDIGMAIRNVLDTEESIKKVMYIDLDVHQGNGVEREFLTDERVYVFDFFNWHIYPHDEEMQKRINHHVKLGYSVTDEDYMRALEEDLPKAIDEARPDFIFYNAGTDIMEGDYLGGWEVTKEGVIRRDKFVFAQAKSREIPIVMVLSGGYQRGIGKVVGASVKEIVGMMVGEE